MLADEISLTMQQLQIFCCIFHCRVSTARYSGKIQKAKQFQEEIRKHFEAEIWKLKCDGISLTMILFLCICHFRRLFTARFWSSGHDMRNQKGAKCATCKLHDDDSNNEDDEDCICAPLKQGRYWEIHPRRPRDFPRVSRVKLKAGGDGFSNFWWRTDNGHSPHHQSI